MNLAELWQLPVLFCCENNLYAMGTAIAVEQSQTDMTAKAASYRVPAARGRRHGRAGLPRRRPAGASTTSATAAARSSSSSAPTASAPHSMFDPELYRDKAEVEHWRERDPIRTFTERCLADGALTDDDVAAIAPRRRGGTGRRGRLCRGRNLGARGGSRRAT